MQYRSLNEDDGLGGVLCGLGPIGVLLALGRVREDGSLQDAGIGAEAVRIRLLQDFRDHFSDQPALVPGGKTLRAVGVFAAVRAVRR